MGPPSDVLVSAERGDSHAADQLLPRVYEELRRMAAAKMAHEKPGQTLDATALVHEAYLRLAPREPRGADYANRRHFFAAAAEAMRRILVDRARAKAAEKRGGDMRRVALEEVPAGRCRNSPNSVTDIAVAEVRRNPPLGQSAERSCVFP